MSFECRMVNFCVRIDKEILWKIVMCCGFTGHFMAAEGRSPVLLHIIRISGAEPTGDGDFRSFSVSRFTGLLYCRVWDPRIIFDEKERKSRPARCYG